MAAYELMVIGVDQTGDKDTKLQTVVEKVVARNKGTVEAVDDWGERPFAYHLKGHDRGNYLIMKLDTDPKTVKKIGNQLRIEKGVLRILITKLGN